MIIDDNYRIERQGDSFVLVQTVEKIRNNTMNNGHFKWNKGDKYTTEEESYYGGLRQALLGYLKSCVNESEEIKDILLNLDAAEKRLKEILYSDHERI